MLLQCSGWTKRYSKSVVFQDLEFSLSAGECLCLIGESGAGKSTFLRSLNFLERVQKGKLFFRGRLISSEEEIKFLRKSMTMVFQNYALWSHLSALENVALPITSVKKCSKVEAIERAQELLEDVGLREMMHRLPKELSGGQQQRVGIARALGLQPAIILMDEPTSSLDPSWVSEVVQVIQKLSDRKQSMIIATHNSALVETLAHRVLEMKDKKIFELERKV